MFPILSWTVTVYFVLAAFKLVTARTTEIIRGRQEKHDLVGLLSGTAVKSRQHQSSAVETSIVGSPRSTLCRITFATCTAGVLFCQTATPETHDTVLLISYREQSFRRPPASFSANLVTSPRQPTLAGLFSIRRVRPS